MNRLFNQINHWLDLHLFLVWLLSIPAILPLVQPTLTNSADGLLHLYRIVALDHAITQSGVIFPRWLPDLVYGYGLPLFVFYAPLSYYITLAPSLVGLNTLTAFNTSFILAILLAGSGTYLFVKGHFGSKAGLLAGIAYVYAPFHLLNTLSRGGLPAAWAMALFPFVFWTFARLIKLSGGAEEQSSKGEKGRKSTLPPLFPLTALILGLALLTHNTLSLLFMPLLGLYLGLELLIRWLWQPTFKAKKSILYVGLALILGFGLAAFFLIPAIFEKEFVHIQRVITPPDFDFHNHFVTLTTLFSLPQPANTGLLNPDFPLTLGLPQVALALLGLIGLLNYHLRQTQKNPLRSTHTQSPNLPISQSHVSEATFFRSPTPLLIITFTTLALSATIFMMLSISVNMWERLPLLAFVQFPHRLLGPTAIVLAILTGAAVVTLPKRFSLGLTVAGIILIFVTSVPLLYPRYHQGIPTNPTLTNMMTYEHISGVIGATSFGEYLPIWVKQIPTESPLESMYQTNTTIQRLDLNTLPPNATLQQVTYTFNQVNLIIDSPEPYQAIFHTFYFPGWTALIDSQPTAITPTSERGLISVDMPAGQHQLDLRFQETPLRKAANSLSIGTLIIILLILIISLTRNQWSAENITSTRFTQSQLTLLITLAFILIAAKLLYFDRFDTPLKHTFNDIPYANVSTSLNFGDQINLLGYDLAQNIVKPGHAINLTLYWQAQQPQIIDYSALAHLIDDKRHLYAGQDNPHPGSFPVTKWQPWGFVKDPHTIVIPHGTPPGDYFLATGLYEPTTWLRLPVTADGDTTWGDIMVIPITITKTTQTPTLAELAIQWPLTKTFGPDLQLLGATPERETIRRNDFLRIAIFWEALKKPATDYQISLRLVNATDQVALQETSRPSHNRYPATRWSTGERVRDNHALWIPANFPAGTYRVQVQVLDEEGQSIGVWIDLGIVGAAIRRNK